MNMSKEGHLGLICFVIWCMWMHKCRQGAVTPSLTSSCETIVLGFFSLDESFLDMKWPG